MSVWVNVCVGERLYVWTSKVWDYIWSSLVCTIGNAKYLGPLTIIALEQTNRNFFWFLKMASLSEITRFRYKCEAMDSDRSSAIMIGYKVIDFDVVEYKEVDYRDDRLQSDELCTSKSLCWWQMYIGQWTVDGGQGKEDRRFDKGSFRKLNVAYSNIAKAGDLMIVEV